jgi:hypothetical protein
LSTPRAKDKFTFDEQSINNEAEHEQRMASLRKNERIKRCEQKESKEAVYDCHEFFGELDAPPAGEDSVIGFANLISRWMLESKPSRRQRRRACCFESSTTPQISVVDYISRIHKYFCCSDECFVLALVFIDRVCQKNSWVKVSELTAHRLVMTALLISAKLHDDVYYSNKYYAKVGGLSLEETNALEAAMLNLLEWQISVSVNDYRRYHGIICRRLQI